MSLSLVKVEYRELGVDDVQWFMIGIDCLFNLLWKLNENKMVFEFRILDIRTGTYLSNLDWYGMGKLSKHVKEFNYALR